VTYSGATPPSRRRVSQVMSELCATLDTTQDAAHVACGTRYESVRNSKTDEGQVGGMRVFQSRGAGKFTLRDKAAVNLPHALRVGRVKRCEPRAQSELEPQMLRG
jgi:hypothetical protein